MAATPWTTTLESLKPGTARRTVAALTLFRVHVLGGHALIASQAPEMRAHYLGKLYAAEDAKDAFDDALTAAIAMPNAQHARDTAMGLARLERCIAQVLKLQGQAAKTVAQPDFVELEEEEEELQAA